MMKQQLVVLNQPNTNLQKKLTISTLIQQTRQIFSNRMFKRSLKYSNFISNTLIFNKQTHLVAVFKDQMIADYIDEFLRRIYLINETIDRIPKIVNYYKNYLKFFCNPMFSDFKSNQIVVDLGDRKAELYYKNNYGNKNKKQKENENNRNIGDSSEISFDNFGKVGIIFTESISKGINLVKSIKSSGINSKISSFNENNEKNFTFFSSLDDSVLGNIINKFDNQNILESGHNQFSNNDRKYKIKKNPITLQKEKICSISKITTNSKLNVLNVKNDLNMKKSHTKNDDNNSSPRNIKGVNNEKVSLLQKFNMNRISAGKESNQSKVKIFVNKSRNGNFSSKNVMFSISLKNQKSANSDNHEAQFHLTNDKIKNSQLIQSQAKSSRNTDVLKNIDKKNAKSVKNKDFQGGKNPPYIIHQDNFKENLTNKKPVGNILFGILEKSGQSRNINQVTNPENKLKVIKTETSKFLRNNIAITLDKLSDKQLTPSFDKNRTNLSSTKSNLNKNLDLQINYKAETETPINNNKSKISTAIPKLILNPKMKFNNSRLVLQEKNLTIKKNNFITVKSVKKK